MIILLICASIFSAIISYIRNESFIDSIIIIIIVSNILEKFKTNKYVQYCMYGLRAASVGLISVAGLRVAEAAFLRSQLFAETGSLTDLFNIKAFIFGVVLYVVYKKTGKHPIIYILASGVIGVILSL